MPPRDKRAPADTFHIEFDTESMPGKIIALGVTLKRDITSDPTKFWRVDLKDHPLYPALCRYCKGNPVKEDQ